MAILNSGLLNLRAGLFYLFYSSFTLAFTTIAIFFIWFLPLRKKFSCLVWWNKVILLACRFILGIRYEVSGLENLPKDTPYVALSNHQSQLETFILMLLLKPVSIILKKELLNIPGFGWGLRLLKPIPIDRSSPKKSLRQIQSDGLSRLQDDKVPVMIFPEGTRVPVGETRSFARSGAALAVAANVPVIFIAHNAGNFWPANTFSKKPGLVEVIISAPQSVEGKTAKEITREAEEWIHTNIKEAQFN